jgi:RimJ/RimL family protein N-acetyltransferase
MPQVERLPERVEGDGLLLRRWTPDDVPALAELTERNVEHLRPWMPWIAFEPLSIGARRALERDWDQRWRRGVDSVMAIVSEEGIVGSIGLHRNRGSATLEIGYWVDRDRTGQGIATRAVRLLTAAGLAVPGITVMEIRHDLTNYASRRVPEKLGYACVGDVVVKPLAPGETGVHVVWQMTAERWAT